MKNENSKKTAEEILELFETFDATTVELERTDEDHDVHMIRYVLSFPPNKRTNFLRVPLPNGGSAI